MTTQLPSPPLLSGPEGASTRTPSLPPPARRGATLIPEAVVARITVRAAREALIRHTGRPPARLGLGPAHSTAAVHEGSARLKVSLDLPYPVDIARTCGEIRQYITDRVSHLTGLRIDDLTVSVQRLVSGESLRRGRAE
ncbi:Asp23/Gls24 family envelope stress response protein [Streptomyces nigrescens]|uniref:Asp23/Gls24 family envelope stress response protein n=1 Tax=Streptomyces nigrescens TaxID=1920 RepID=UPI003479305C